MYKLITFDIYSASCDINGSGIPKVKEILNLSFDEAKEFFVMWRKQQWNYLLLNNSMDDGYYSYCYITRTVLDYTLKKFKLTAAEKQIEDLMLIWTSFSAWPETKEVIEEIKRRGYKVAMLSNGDVEMLKLLEISTNIKFDYIFSADGSGCYKPNKDIYENVFEKTGLKKSEVLHVAGSIFDVMGAVSAGMNCAWSNRNDESILDLKYEPTYYMKNLKDLLEIL